MKKSIFVTATGTDVGKTYVTALLLKKMREYGYDAGYYKAALSGINSLETCDAGFVKKIANLEDDVRDMVSFMYKNAYSPHLASKVEGNPVDFDVVKKDFEKMSNKYDFLLVEGSGGIVCPIRYDEKKIMLSDIVKELSLDVLVVSGASLGSINSCVLTISYLKNLEINVKGIIINNYEDSIIQNDNIFMIEDLTGVKVVAKVKNNDYDIDISKEIIDNIFG